MEYTVKKLAKLSGITVRALHYYDQIGLLKPNSVKANGYRVYNDRELEMLQQIMFFRELGFSLRKIKQIVQDNDFNVLQALTEQRTLLTIKKKRLENLLLTIDKTFNSLKEGESMSDDAKFSAFSDQNYQKYKNEVESRWGNTKAYIQSMKKVGKMSKKNLDDIKVEAEDIYATIANLYMQGLIVESLEVQNQIERFYQHLGNFYEPSYEMFKNLGYMYVDDERFKEFYEKRAKGLAHFMRDAMAYYANKHNKNA